ncbi:MAG TPA: hypothetical protein HA348_06035 [Thermoplasmata archaeon]|nr:hypothetical protein [Thermoplasmata archaeon]
MEEKHNTRARSDLENFTLEGMNVYLIKELYENPLNETYWVEVKSGIYYMEFDE